MKCPKCGYLGFETGDRCRNCGYDFSLAASKPAALDFVLDPETEPVRISLDLDRIIGAPEPAAPMDLPLFAPSTPSTGQNVDVNQRSDRGQLGDAAHGVRRRSSDDDTPLVSPSHPRAPLGVRRATPEIPRARPRVSKTPSQTTNLFGTSPAAVKNLSVDARRATPEWSVPLASPARRVMAAIVDGFLLSVLDAIVLYLTLRLCGLTAAQIVELPLIPLAAFFVLLNGGYFVAFTAVGGQSIGKMAAGIKVISEEDDYVPVGRAMLRTLAYLISALPFGAGFLPGIFSADRLALHDRLAHTRVVQPSQT
jgi:uncharacterized RDD family membrane protein YckC